jgi:hypothetical protein
MSEPLRLFDLAAKTYTACFFFPGDAEALLAEYLPPDSRCAVLRHLSIIKNCERQLEREIVRRARARAGKPPSVYCYAAHFPFQSFRTKIGLIDYAVEFSVRDTGVGRFACGKWEVILAEEALFQRQFELSMYQ